MDILFPIISIGVSFLLVYIILPFLKVHIGEKEVSLAKDVIDEIVASLEEENLSGKEKKNLAMTLAREILRLKKINIPDMFLSALIESSLYFLRKQFGKKITPKEKGVIATYSVKTGKLN